MSGSTREWWRNAKDNVKESWRAGKGWVKENVVEPVLGYIGLQEGAGRRKGQVEEFMQGLGEQGDLRSLSVMVAQTSKVVRAQFLFAPCQ